MSCRILLSTLCFAAAAVHAQPALGSFDAVSLGPDGAPLRAFAGVVEVTEAGVFAAGGVLLTDDGHFGASVKRSTGNGWVAVGDMTGEVVALEAAPDGALYAVGQVTGSESNLVRWDGEAWSDIPFGTSTDVLDVAIAPDGTVAVVTLSGWPSENVSVRVLQGGTWQTLGGPLPVPPTDLALSSADEVYVSGASGVQRWNGTAWVAAGGAFDGPVTTLVVGDAGLVAGGSFTSVGSVTAAYVAAWDGTEWTALGSGLPGPVSRLSEAAGRVAALSLPAESGPPVLGLWTGAEWETSALPVNSQVRDVAVAAAGDVFITGSFFDAAYGDLSAVHRRSGSAWLPIGSAVNGHVLSFARGDGGRPVMAGLFTTAGGVSALGVAQNEPGGWSALGDGMPRTSLSNAVLARGADGRLYAAGRFVVPGGFRTLAVWDGKAWATLGPLEDRRAVSLHLGADGSLYAGKVFGESTVERWTGSGWVQVGDAFDLGVEAFATAPDGRLCAGGGFRSVGAAPLQGVACWDGAAWGPLGASLDLPEGVGASVRSLVFGTDGTPYVGGVAVGGVDVGVVAWTGSEWAAVPGTPSPYVEALAVHPDGTLYAAGNVSISSGAFRLSAWDGEAWSIVGETSDLSGSVSALWIDDAGSVWVGGAFDVIGGVHSPKVARYDPPPATAGDRLPAARVPLRVAPNPVHGAAHLTATVPAGAAEVSVYDMLGRRVAVAFEGETAGALSVPLDTARLAPGVYVARVHTAGGAQTVRFTVVR